jgi:hypothetical protein
LGNAQHTIANMQIVRALARRAHAAVSSAFGDSGKFKCTTPNYSRRAKKKCNRRLRKVGNVPNQRLKCNYTLEVETLRNCNRVF